MGTSLALFEAHPMKTTTFAATLCILTVSASLVLAAEAFDLSHWKLTLPVGESGAAEGHPMEVQAAKLTGGYTHTDYFYKGTEGQLVFWCPVTGTKTENTEFPRSELREVINPDDDNVCWAAPGTHLLKARCRVIEVPSTQKVTIGQIHGYSGKAKPLIKLQFFKGHVEALVKENASKGKDLKLTFPSVGMDKEFDYEIKLQDGLLSITINDSTQAVNVFEKDPNWAKQTLFFKVGAYTQDNEGPTTEGARVSFSTFKVSHTGGTTPASK